MPDITMCDNDTCPSRLKCYRFMATPNTLHQWYQTFAVPKKRKKCSYYLPLSKSGNKKTKNCLK